MTPEELIAIKARIKNLMSSRDYAGASDTLADNSLGRYAWDGYDFEVPPAKDGVLLFEYADKTVNLLRRINTDKIGGRDVGPEVQYGGQDVDCQTFSYANMSAILDYLERETFVQGERGYYEGFYNGGRPVQATEATSCEAHCTGICVGSCFGKCNGCWQSCGGGCKNACTGGCGSGCTGCSGCSSGCNAGCISSCGHKCGACHNSSGST